MNEVYLIGNFTLANTAWEETIPLLYLKRKTIYFWFFFLLCMHFISQNATRRALHTNFTLLHPRTAATSIPQHSAEALWSARCWGQAESGSESQTWSRGQLQKWHCKEPTRDWCRLSSKQLLAAKKRAVCNDESWNKPTLFRKKQRICLLECPRAGSGASVLWEHQTLTGKQGDTGWGHTAHPGTYMENK